MGWNVERVFWRAKSQGWTDRELARRMGIAQSTVSRVRSGTTQPSLAFYQGVRRAFPETDPDTLMWRDGTLVPA